MPGKSALLRTRTSYPLMQGGQLFFLFTCQHPQQIENSCNVFWPRSGFSLKIDRHWLQASKPGRRLTFPANRLTGVEAIENGWKNFIRSLNWRSCRHRTPSHRKKDSPRLLCCASLLLSPSITLSSRLSLRLPFLSNSFSSFIYTFRRLPFVEIVQEPVTFLSNPGPSFPSIPVF